MKYKVGDKVRVHDTYKGELEGVVAEVFSRAIYPYSIVLRGESEPEQFYDGEGSDPFFPEDYIIGLAE